MLSRLTNKSQRQISHKSPWLIGALVMFCLLMMFKICALKL